MRKMVNGVAMDCTQEEIDENNARQAEWQAGQFQRDYAAALAQRKSRYTVESDPIYMEWQYDVTPESEQIWRDKVAQIKLDIPLPQ